MSDTLRCSKCQRVLPVDDFQKDKKARLCRGGRAWECRECVAARGARLRGRNRKLIREAKDVPCVDCGVQYPLCATDFDHVRGKKLFGLSEASSYSLQKVKDEIAKCDIVCANCHRVRTHKRREEKRQRGETVGCIVPRGTRISPKTQTPSLPDTPTLY